MTELFSLQEIKQILRTDIKFINRNEYYSTDVIEDTRNNKKYPVEFIKINEEDFIAREDILTIIKNRNEALKERIKRLNKVFDK